MTAVDPCAREKKHARSKTVIYPSVTANCCRRRPPCRRHATAAPSLPPYRRAPRCRPVPHLGGPRVDPRSLRSTPRKRRAARVGHPRLPPEAPPATGVLGHQRRRQAGAAAPASSSSSSSPSSRCPHHHRCRCVCHISHHMMIHRPSLTSQMFLMLDGSSADARQAPASALPGQPLAEGSAWPVRPFRQSMRNTRCYPGHRLCPSPPHHIHLHPRPHHHI